MPSKETGFRGTSLKADFYASIEQFIKQHPDAGYKSVSDFVQESARLRMQELRQPEPQLPRFEKINCDEDGVKIHDRELERVVDVHFKPSGITCTYDETDDCVHIDFALSVREVKDIIREKRKEGWKLPDA